MSWKKILRHFGIDDFIIDLVSEIIDEECEKAIDDYEIGKAYSY